MDGWIYRYRYKYRFRLIIYIYIYGNTINQDMLIGQGVCCICGLLSKSFMQEVGLKPDLEDQAEFR